MNAAARRLAAALIGAMAATLPAAVLPGCATPARAATTSGDAPSFYEDALKRLEAGDGAAAVIQLRNALQHDPQNRDARLLLGQLYLRGGDGAAAEKELRRAQAIAPDDSTRLLLAQALLAQRKFEAALELTEAPVGDGASRADALLVRGSALMGLDRLDEAAASIEAALAEEPDSPAAHYAMARLHLVAGRLDAAAREIAVALAANPEFVPALLLRADLALARGELDAAAAAVEDAAAIRPADAEVLLARAQIRLRQGDFAAAGRDADAILERDPENLLAHYLRAVVEIGKGDYVAAQRIFVQVEDRLRGYPPALLLEGMIALETGQHARAELALNRYITARPDNPLAYHLLARTHLRADDPAAAVELLERYTQAHPLDAAALPLLASAQARMGDRSAAIATYERAARSGARLTSQQARSTLELLAAVVPQAGDDGTAYDPAGPGAQPSQIVDVLALRDAGELDAALAAAEQLFAANPDDPLSASILGSVRAARGEAAPARRAFEQALSLDPGFAAAQRSLDLLDIRAGHPEAVEARLRDRMAAAPDDIEAIGRLADLLRAGERPAEAVSLLAEAVARLPEALPLQRRLIALHLELGAAESAAAAARELWTQVPADPAALELAANTLMTAGQLDDALAAFADLVALRDGAVDARLQLARAQLDAGRAADAAATYDAILEEDPANVAAAAGRIEIQIRAGEIEAARALAQGLAASDATAAAELDSSVLLRSGRADEAVAVLESAFEEHPGSRMAIVLALARDAAGDSAGARSGLRRWLRREPQDHDARLVLGELLMASGQHAEAAQEYERVLAQDPGNVLVLNNLAWLKGELGAADAIEVARHAYRLAPQSGAVADTLGWMLFKAGRPAEALGLLREAAVAAPGNPDILYHLAAALAEAGEREEAQRLLERALALTPPFAERAQAEALQVRLGG